MTCVPPSREFINITRFSNLFITNSRVLHENSSYCLVENTLEGCLAFFQHDPLDYETIYTLGAMAGSKLNAYAQAPLMEELEGYLCLYEGFVSIVTYEASDYKHKDLYGAEGIENSGRQVLEKPGGQCGPML